MVTQEMEKLLYNCHAEYSVERMKASPQWKNAYVVRVPEHGDVYVGRDGGLYTWNHTDASVLKTVYPIVYLEETAKVKVAKRYRSIVPMLGIDGRLLEPGVVYEPSSVLGWWSSKEGAALDVFQPTILDLRMFAPVRTKIVKRKRFILEQAADKPRIPTVGEYAGDTNGCFYLQSTVKHTIDRPHELMLQEKAIPYTLREEEFEVEVDDE